MQGRHNRVRKMVFRFTWYSAVEVAWLAQNFRHSSTRV